MCVCVGGPGQGGHLQGVQAHDLRLHPRIQQEEPHGRPVRLLYILLFIYILVLSVSDPYSLNPDPDPAKNLYPDPEDPCIRIRNTAIIVSI